jgi:hypothetical protein
MSAVNLTYCQKWLLMEALPVGVFTSPVHDLQHLIEATTRHLF